MDVDHFFSFQLTLACVVQFMVRFEEPEEEEEEAPAAEPEPLSLNQAAQPESADSSVHRSTAVAAAAGAAAAAAPAAPPPAAAKPLAPQFDLLSLDDASVPQTAAEPDSLLTSMAVETPAAAPASAPAADMWDAFASAPAPVPPPQPAMQPVTAAAHTSSAAAAAALASAGDEWDFFQAPAALHPAAASPAPAAAPAAAAATAATAAPPASLQVLGAAEDPFEAMARSTSHAAGSNVGLSSLAPAGPPAQQQPMDPFAADPFAMPPLQQDRQALAQDLFVDDPFGPPLGGGLQDPSSSAAPCQQPQQQAFAADPFASLGAPLAPTSAALFPKQQPADPFAVLGDLGDLFHPPAGPSSQQQRGALPSLASQASSGLSSGGSGPQHKAKLSTDGIMALFDQQPAGPLGAIHSKSASLGASGTSSGRAPMALFGSGALSAGVPPSGAQQPSQPMVAAILPPVARAHSSGSGMGAAHQHTASAPLPASFGRPGVMRTPSGLAMNGSASMQQQAKQKADFADFAVFT